ncbi:MAG: uroporphyrinogen decarboxylase [Myxococcota bacterium]
MLSPRQRFVRAARGEDVDRTPVWLMRQAGRYLPEYREVRARTGFLESCRSPELAAELALQPFRRFGMDGVVVFSDILLPLGGVGLDFDFAPGPVLRNPVSGAEDLFRLDGDVGGAIAPTCAAIRALRSELEDRAAVIGFAGAPWTLAAYASEARLSRDLHVLGALSYRDPTALDRLLDRMADVAAQALAAQIEAGADALQLFDTWAGLLDERRFRAHAGRALRRVLDALPRDRPPVIVYARGAPHLLEALCELGADVVSLDWRSDLADAAKRVGARVSLQGNLDPAALHASPAQIRGAVRSLIQAGRGARGHILNLGHGIQVGTPPEAVAAFVDAAQEP